jgi:putative endonuclease
VEAQGPVADDRQKLGLRGERAASRALEGAGLTVIERRYRTRRGEIDLIATRGALVVFVEVKTRRGFRYGSPAEAVTALKRRRMAQVAQHYLWRRGWLERPCRFDVIEVLGDGDREGAIRHIADAFRLWPSG